MLAASRRQQCRERVLLNLKSRIKKLCKSKLTMKKKTIILSILILFLIGCGQTTKKQTVTLDLQDTVIVKKKNVFHQSGQTDFYSKSYSYYWLVSKDTLDFVFCINEYKKDNTFSLRIFHKEPMSFKTILEKIEECIPLIEEDFNLSKLTSINFEAPIFYLDLAKKMSSEYVQEFGRKNVTYERFSKFLFKSSLHSQLCDFLNPLNKEVRHYGFEKFFLIEKEHYGSYLPNTDFTEYPEFTFNAHSGISVSLQDK